MKAEVIFGNNEELKRTGEGSFIQCDEDNHFSQMFGHGLKFDNEELEYNHRINFVVPNDPNDVPVILKFNDGSKTWIRRSELTLLRQHLQPTDEITSYEYVMGSIGPFGPKTSKLENLDAYEVIINFNRKPEKIIFPEFIYWKKDDSHYYMTEIRFERNGKYYLIGMSKCFSDEYFDPIKSTQIFMKDCYRTQLFAKVNLDKTNGVFITGLDPNQQTEKERLGNDGY